MPERTETPIPTERVKEGLESVIVALMAGTQFLGLRALKALGRKPEEVESQSITQPTIDVELPDETVEEVVDSPIEESESEISESEDFVPTLLGSPNKKVWQTEVRRSFDVQLYSGSITSEWAYGHQSRTADMGILLSVYSGAVSHDRERIAVILPWVSLRFQANKTSESLARKLVAQIRRQSDGSLRAAYIVGGKVMEDDQDDLMPTIAYFGEGRDPLPLNTEGVFCSPVALVQDGPDSDLHAVSQIEDQREVRISYMGDSLDSSQALLREQVDLAFETIFYS